MKNSIGILITIHSLIGIARAIPTSEEFLQQRNSLLEDEIGMMLGGNLILNDPKENRINEILMELKRREFKEGLDSNGNHFAAAQHFFHSKSQIENSHIFKIVKLLPKGCALHVHMSQAPQLDFVIKTLSYMENLYICQDGLETFRFHFYASQPADECSAGRNWTLLSEVRASSSSVDSLDAILIQAMSLYSPQPDVDYPNTNVVWQIFEDKTDVLSGISTYEPAFRQYLYKGIEEFYEDNVMYIEQRTSASSAYRLDQSLLPTTEIFHIYEDVIQQFQVDHPDFWGYKMIYSPNRFQTPDALSTTIKKAVELKAQFPDLIIGFDLVGQEDVGTPLLDYLSQLLEASANDLKFFLHAGETAWHGTKIDENMIDAVLLNTSRLGHAYALASHPLLAEIVQEKKIAMEVNPISNQVLGLVHDLRNHPAISLMKADFPMVISSDDPGTWGARGLSHDWYVAFMAMAGQHADLRFLKQLALNSIEYSGMSEDDKVEAFSRWNDSWTVFLDEVIAQYDLGTFR